MTYKRMVVCDGDGEDCHGKTDDESEFSKRYKKVDPNNDQIVEARHYCSNCDIPDGLMENHPINQTLV